MSASDRYSGRARAGFTLLELLVSMTIVTLLVVLLGQMLSRVSGAWSMAESNKERLQNMRAISDVIKKEMQAALLPVNPAATANLQFVANPPSIPAAYRNRDAVFWQTPLASDQTLGDVAEVGYYIKWDQQVAKLCRFFVNPGKTVSGVAVSDSNFLIYSEPSNWLSQDTINAVAPADLANHYQGLFAENVLGLWVQFLDPNGEPITQDANGAPFDSNGFDSRRGYTYRDSNGNSVTRHLPAVVNLSFAMIDARSAQRITPSLKETITSLVTSSTTAEVFVSGAQTNPALHSISPGLRYYQTEIYLQNSK
jgi:prepilin-type N-terminal cleavage/methylation domain-containing protein